MKDLLQADLLIKIDTLLRIAVFLIILTGGVSGLSLWYNRKINHLSVSKYWRLFIMGVIFYAVGAFSDIFTPIFASSLGFHNLLTETNYLIGLSLILVSLCRFMIDYTEAKRERVHSPETEGETENA